MAKSSIEVLLVVIICGTIFVSGAPGENFNEALEHWDAELEEAIYHEDDHFEDAEDEDFILGMDAIFRYLEEQEKKLVGEKVKVQDLEEEEEEVPKVEEKSKKEDKKPKEEEKKPNHEEKEKEESKKPEKEEDKKPEKEEDKKPQEPEKPKQPKCSAWLQPCHVWEDCCRNLECAFYHGKCTPVYGLIIPGRDQRPIGDGPFPNH